MATRSKKRNSTLLRARPYPAQAPAPEEKKEEEPVGTNSMKLKLAENECVHITGPLVTDSMYVHTAKDATITATRVPPTVLCKVAAVRGEYAIVLGVVAPAGYEDCVGFVTCPIIGDSRGSCDVPCWKQYQFDKACIRYLDKVRVDYQYESDVLKLNGIVVAPTTNQPLAELVEVPGRAKPVTASASTPSSSSTSTSTASVTKAIRGAESDTVVITGELTGDSVYVYQREATGELVKLKTPPSVTVCITDKGACISITCTGTGSKVYKDIQITDTAVFVDKRTDRNESFHVSVPKRVQFGETTVTYRVPVHVDYSVKDGKISFGGEFITPTRSSATTIKVAGKEASVYPKMVCIPVALP